MPSNDARQPKTFTPDALRHLAGIMAKHATGSALSAFFTDAGYPELDVAGSSKATATAGQLRAIQGRDKGYFEVLSVLAKYCAPERFFGKGGEYREIREEFNEVLSHYGTEIGDDGLPLFGPSIHPYIRSRNEDIYISVTIRDVELRERVSDLLDASGHYDRAVSQAGVLLEHRVRQRIEAPATLIGVDLMTEAFRKESGKLAFSDVAAEQEGVHQLFRGFIATFKNPSSHRVIPTYSREQAGNIVAFVDVLLEIVAGARDR
ncbi:MAG: TIGR02391 family protein [Dehalococcoidia bacterium]